MADDFDDRSQPRLDCDLIMKGGITSGVVFPKAITRLANRYRFVNIGGTSAGAIAAVMTAAAEYRRFTGKSAEEKLAGFAVIDAMSNDLAENLKSLFQPAEATRPLFILAMTLIASGGRLSAFAIGAFRAYWGRSLVSALPGLALLVWSICAWNIWSGLVGVLLLLGLPVIGIARALWRALTVTLPQHNYGICPGLRADETAPPAFTDWLADKLDAASGRDPNDPNYKPLTAADLKGATVTVASVTTDLSSGRPYQLPVGIHIFSFRKAEFDRLFPPRIVTYLIETGGPLLGSDTSAFRDSQNNADYYKLPAAGDFPILLVARLSLSFPGLISAVPLYRFDDSVKSASNKSEFVRCLFSDGGITSNFPIHFFDALLPGRPTFGISLGSLDKRVPRAQRIFLPTLAQDGSAPAAHAIFGILNFADAILTTARNWQDTLQSRLHGYRERIVEIRLDDETEGGLNLHMEKAVVGRLAALGDEAAGQLLDDFRFDEHRWRRAVTALPTLGSALATFSRVWDDTYRTVLLEHQPKGLKSLSLNDRKQLVAFADGLADIGRPLRDAPLPSASAQRANVRVVARIDSD